MRETVRSRIARPGNREIYVRSEELEPEDDVGAVILLFDEDEEEYTHDCFTYGRHLGFGFVSEPDRSKPTARVRWGLLTSMMRTYEGEAKKKIVNDLYSNDITYETYSQCIAEIMRLAKKPRVLFVSHRPPGITEKRVASEHGRTLSYIPISSLPEKTVEDIRTYDVYFYPERFEATS